LLKPFQVVGTLILHVIWFRILKYHSKFIFSYMLVLRVCSQVSFGLFIIEIKWKYNFLEEIFFQNNWKIDPENPGVKWEIIPGFSGSRNGQKPQGGCPSLHTIRALFLGHKEPSPRAIPLTSDQLTSDFTSLLAWNRCSDKVIKWLNIKNHPQSKLLPRVSCRKQHQCIHSKNESIYSTVFRRNFKWKLSNFIVLCQELLILQIPTLV
jgi:hypothetical protein